MTEEAQIVVADPPGRQRFELAVDGELAGFLPFCPFVNEWMKRHREYVDLVPAAYRANFDL